MQHTSLFIRNVESLVRERFVRAVKTGMSELRLKKATASPIQRVIENAVVEVCIWLDHV